MFHFCSILALLHGFPIVLVDLYIFMTNTGTIARNETSYSEFRIWVLVLPSTPFLPVSISSLLPLIRVIPVCFTTTCYLFYSFSPRNNQTQLPWIQGHSSELTKPPQMENFCCIQCFYPTSENTTRQFFHLASCFQTTNEKLTFPLISLSVCFIQIPPFGLKQ